MQEKCSLRNRVNFLQADEAMEKARQAARGRNWTIVNWIFWICNLQRASKSAPNFSRTVSRVELNLEEMTTSAQIQALQEKQIHLGLMIPPVK